MEIEYTEKATIDLAYWKKYNFKKITSLIESISENPYESIGKPEPLKYHLTGRWSRRINQEHRVVYEIKENTIFILSLKGHY